MFYEKIGWAREASPLVRETCVSDQRVVSANFSRSGSEWVTADNAGRNRYLDRRFVLGAVSVYICYLPAIGIAARFRRY